MHGYNKWCIIRIVIKSELNLSVITDLKALNSEKLSIDVEPFESKNIIKIICEINRISILKIVVHP